MKYLLLLLATTLSITVAKGQAFDCSGAIAVCSNDDFNENSSGSGIDDFSNPNNESGCIDTENQAAWFFVQIEDGRNLGFIIDPNGADDYDFAVYGPDVTCDNLGDPIRCSWAAGSSNTGMTSTASDVSEGAGGDGFVNWINVSQGETYYILIDNYSNSNTGFDLTWSGDASLDCDITLPCPTIDLGNDTILCDGGNVTLGVPEFSNETYLWSTGATGHEITVSDSGWYWLDATRDTCTIRDSIYLGLATTPDVNLGNDTTLCQGQTLLLDATDQYATGYIWQDGSTSPTFTVTTAGIYSVGVYEGVCAGTDAIEVFYDSPPVIDLGVDTILCDESQFILNAFNPTATGYEWQDGSMSSTFTATATGIYTVNVTNTGCNYRDTITLFFEGAPDLNLGAFATQCDGDTVILDAYTSSALNYLWHDGSTNSSFEVVEPGTYWVEVSSANCTTSDTVDIVYIPNPEIDLGMDTVVCNEVTLDLNATSSISTATYEWQDGSTNPTYTADTNGVYSVTVANGSCLDSDTIAVDFKKKPEFNIGLDTLICRGTEWILSAEDQDDDVSYLWQDNSIEPILIVTEQGIYNVAVSNSCGTSYDTIYVKYGSCNCDFYLPTGFTPNNDGLNEAFGPIVDCDSLQEYSFEIYNRWGESIFYSEDPELHWKADDNQRYPIDSYVWIIQYKWTWRGKEMSRQDSGAFAILR